MHNQEYEEYLKSPRWRIKRLIKARQAHYTCEICGKVIKRGFHIHHLTYEHFGNEPLEDLAFLCEECHTNLHYDKTANKKISSGKNRRNSKKKSCNNCYFSQITTYTFKKGKREVLFCNKHVKECDSLCTSYKKGSYKKPFIKKTCTPMNTKHILKATNGGSSARVKRYR